MSQDSKEPWMDVVKEEDHTMVRDVLALMNKLSFKSVFSITVAPKGYEITAWVQPAGEPSAEININCDDLMLLQQVNDLRVKVIGVRLLPDLSKACVRIRIVSTTERCMITDEIVMRVRKRSRWWSWNEGDPA